MNAQAGAVYWRGPSQIVRVETGHWEHGRCVVYNEQPSYTKSSDGLSGERFLLFGLRIMNILFVGNVASTTGGGIETWILRTVSYLWSIGQSITTLFPSRRGSEEEYIIELSKYSKIEYSESKHPHFFCYSKKLNLTNYDIIFCVGINSLKIGLILKQEYQITNAKIVIGVFHPREYCIVSKWWRYTKILIDDVLDKIPENNIIFMNEANARELSSCHGRNFFSSPIVQLPININQYMALNRRIVNKSKIVSIGSINNFKKYHFVMIDIIDKLNKKGYNYEYHIYGTGPDKENLERYIESKSLSNKIYLHGWLSYSKFSEPLSDAFIFIGMGTSLVEAAACGVPALIAIDSNREPTTYGFFHDTKGYNVGEVDPRYNCYYISLNLFNHSILSEI